MEWKKLSLSSSHDGELIRITLKAPKANIIDGEMMGELSVALEGLDDDPTEPPDLDHLGAFMPEAEIAAMHHEVQDSRLFGN